MNHRYLSATAAAGAFALAVALIPAVSQAATVTPHPTETRAPHSDNLPNVLGDQQAELREAAVDQLANGEAELVTKGGQQVIELTSKAAPGSRPGSKGKSRFVLYDVDREESILTVLSEFSDTAHPVVGGAPGPQHNEIPAPDRVMDGGATDDNSTIWQPDFSRAHYLDLMFADSGQSFKDFYLKQSNGRFLAKGDVSDWVQVPYNEARYGSNSFSESSTYWPFVRDTGNAWYAQQVAQGRTSAEIKAYLAQFDQVDRYDFDGDGNFNEPDGYIDHFQAIHAGEGEEAGGGAQGADAIWSHRWYAFQNLIGSAGPTGNLAGGTQIGDTGYWIGDYTTEPENGGLGVFTHEFGHDLGLPDLYDTAGGDNGTGFWTLMSAGSWLNRGGQDIGSTPGYMGAWEKLQLGWLDYRTAAFGKRGLYALGPADRDGKRTPQAIKVDLPDQTVVTTYNTPASGSYEWWSGSADNLDVSLSRPVDLTGATTASLSANLWYDIESGYDTLSLEIRPTGTVPWTTVGGIIDGNSGGGENGTPPAWVSHSWDLTPYAGQPLDLRFRYFTDGGVHYAGAFIDDIALTSDNAAGFTDDVEAGTNGWAAAGFTRMNGSTSRVGSRYYLAENRTYNGYDRGLKTGPYNFGWSSTQPDRVERFPYQNGLLVWYVNNTYDDNNTSVHPGGGQVLPVDARAKSLVFPDGVKVGNRRQPFDATFNWEKTDKVVLHRNGAALTIPSRAGVPVFDDSDPDRYYDATNPMNSVKVAGEGVSIAVVANSRDDDDMLIWVDSRR